MCVIIYIPPGPQRPAKDLLKFKEDLRAAFNYNDDGAGYAVLMGGKVTYKKGYFHFKQLWADVMHFIDVYPLILHFRIGTGSRCNKANCHPFNSAALNKKGKTSAGAQLWFMNGVLHEVKSTRNKSDTWRFIEKHRDTLNRQKINNNLLNLMADLTDVKWAYMDKTGAYISDNNFIKYNGAYYSNLNHRSWRSWSWSAYKDDDDQDQDRQDLELAPGVIKDLKKDAQTWSDVQNFMDFYCAGCPDRSEGFCPVTWNACLQDLDAPGIKQAMAFYYEYGALY